MKEMDFLGDKEELGLDDFLRVSDVASQFRRLQEEVGKQLDSGKAREILREKLLKLAEIKGESLTTEQIDAAIESYYADRYSFKQPPKNFETTLANLYINRVKISVGTALILAVTGTTWSFIAIKKAAHLRSLERKVEFAVQAAYNDKQELGEKLQEISSSPIRNQLPSNETAKLNEKTEFAKMRLSSIDSFFLKYCDDGTAQDNIDKENYKEAETQLIPVNESLRAARIQVGEGIKIIDTQKQFVSIKNSLDSLVEEIRNLKPLPGFSEKAESLYNSGISCINNRQLTEAQGYKQQLTSFKEGISSFSDLVSKTERLYADIKIITKEDEAKAQGDKLYQEAKQHQENLNLQGLNSSINRLTELDEILNQEYTLRIVSRPGIKSGMDRYYTDSRGKRVSGYYLIVEAVDSRGNILRKNIKNEENGRTETVTMWGERVSEGVYEKVKEDKLDNGIINNNIVGKKEKGYLNEIITMLGVKKEGQITRW